MLSNGRRLGAHLALGAGMVKAADRAADVGMSALQVFSDNPTSWRRRSAPPVELPAFLARLAHHDVAPLAIHAPYLVNLASPETETGDRSVMMLVNELAVAQAYGARFLNIHIGSHRGDGAEAGIDRLAARVATVFAGIGDGAPDPILVLENGAGGGFGIGATVEELGAIDTAIAAAGVPRERYGYCLDTAHAWGAGYDVGTEAGVDELLAGLGVAVGLHRLHMVHLNDSRAARGSRTDRHEHLGAGQVGVDGIRRVVTHPLLGHVTYYLETPGMEEGYDAVNVARLHDIVAGRPLAALPDAAFTTRSPKGRSAPAETEQGAETAAAAVAGRGR